MTVVTRFAPSPTGYLHIGGARTALFSYLWARKNQGKFILRIEDTDQERSTPEMTQAILKAMEWLGLEYEELYFQSKRQEIHQEYIDKLVAEGKAYWCECSPEEVEQMRQEAMAKGLKPKYNGRCREKNLGPGPGRVVRLKAPLEGETSFVDLVKGKISVQNQELDDLILRRSDGTPTYNLAVVVDDLTMGITHVIRGDDHVNNTHRQILIYKALNAPIPQFAHVPMILGPDKKKLSKRHGALSVMVYKEMGFLPEALLNYLARLGWSYKDQEIFSKAELIEKFSLENLSKSPSVFDTEKLLWLNSHYIKESSRQRLAQLLLEFLQPEGFNPSLAYLEKIVPLYQPRAKTLKEMAEQMHFFLKEAKELDYDAKAVEKFLTPEVIPHLQKIREKIATLTNFEQKALENIFAAYLEENQLKFKVIAQPLRVALTGQTVSPGLFETMEVLGKEEVLNRLQRALELAT
ncbi:MAG: Glutamate--tRNA ligase [Desulfonauticus sp. 38_4375]|jgi:glutamyl-tRNA synthetase|nr:MAG: Glutamate--tRNA ligase [Desulfonauticus sp. 38_4375]